MGRESGIWVSIELTPEKKNGQEGVTLAKKGGPGQETRCAKGKN